MKNIKNLGITTKEGLSVKDFKTFPSHEWGEDGGLSADIYYNKVKVANVYNDGNGGMALLHWAINDQTARDLVKEQVFKALTRLDKDFGPASQYEWMRNKTPAKIDDDDFESLVNILYNQYCEVKEFKSKLKKGYQYRIVLHKGEKTGVVYCVHNDTVAILKILKAHNEDWDTAEAIGSVEQLATI